MGETPPFGKNIQEFLVFMITPFWNRWAPKSKKISFFSDKEISDFARPLPPLSEFFRKKKQFFLCLPLQRLMVAKRGKKEDTITHTYLHISGKTLNLIFISMCTTCFLLVIIIIAWLIMIMVMGIFKLSWWASSYYHDGHLLILMCMAQFLLVVSSSTNW